MYLYIQYGYGNANKKNVPLPSMYSTYIEESLDKHHSLIFQRSGTSNGNPPPNPPPPPLRNQRPTLVHSPGPASFSLPDRLTSKVGSHQTSAITFNPALLSSGPSTSPTSNHVRQQHWWRGNFKKSTATHWGIIRL